jgi:2,5-furandicarboxylate decarboxylase 1
MPNFLGGHLNPVTYGYHREEKGPMETKMIFDMTRPAAPETFPPMCRVPPEVVAAVNPDALVQSLPAGTTAADLA